MVPFALADGFPSFAIEWGNPIFYLNAAGLVFATLLFVRLREMREDGPVYAGGFWGAAVLMVGTGLHFLGDIFSFPEDGDHIFIHATVAVALLVFWLVARRD